MPKSSALLAEPSPACWAPATNSSRYLAIVASFFGDGATEEGVFAETLNFAALKRLPILFVCENNQYAIHTHQSRRQGALDICERARAFGISAERLDGNDLNRLIDRACEVTARIRAGEGPYFLEARTYRWREHVGPNCDYDLGYRSESEGRSWIEADPRAEARRRWKPGLAP